MKHSKGKSGRIVFDQDFRVKVVKTALEKNLSTQEISQLYGISNACWYNWKKKYEEVGEEGLRDAGCGNKNYKKKISEKLR